MSCCGVCPRSCSLEMYGLGGQSVAPKPIKICSRSAWKWIHAGVHQGVVGFQVGGINDLPKAGATAMATTLSDESWQISCGGSISGNPLDTSLVIVRCWTNNQLCFLCHCLTSLDHGFKSTTAGTASRGLLSWQRPTEKTLVMIKHEGGGGGSGGGGGDDHTSIPNNKPVFSLASRARSRKLARTACQDISGITSFQGERALWNSSKLGYN